MRSIASKRLATVWFSRLAGIINHGRGGHCILLDDPIKDRTERLWLVREKLWSWYNQVLRTRLMDSTGSIVIVQNTMDRRRSGRASDRPDESALQRGRGRGLAQDRPPALAEENDISAVPRASRCGRSGSPSNIWRKSVPPIHVDLLRCIRAVQALKLGPSSDMKTLCLTTAWTRCLPTTRCGSTRRQTMPYPPSSPTILAYW